MTAVCIQHLTHYMQQTSWEADSSSADHDITPLRYPSSIIAFTTTRHWSLRRSWWIQSSLTSLRINVKLYLCSNRHHAIKTCLGSGGIAPCILNLGARWMWVVIFTLTRLTAGENTLSTNWIGGWVGTRTGLDAVVKRKIPSPCLESNPDRTVRSLINTPTELALLFLLL
jgi:hypothetical protein